MGCGSCGTGKDGAPGGCKSHGNCASGGCNRMNVYDWLADIPLANADDACKVIEISFNNGSRKDYFKNPGTNIYEKGDMVALEGVNGFDVGMINLTGELVRLQLKKNKIDERSPDIKKILRRATDTDIAKLTESKGREKDMLIRSRAMAKVLNLNMKMAEVELQADGKKATFFYIADERVDFRELIRQYATEFKVKVEMRQIGARQEAGKVGGIGSCGRELCCSTWLTDFKSVNTTAARYQNLSINQTKLSGQCGRLKCCLNYELDTYMDALQFFPQDADVLETTRGRAFLIKKDIFRFVMWYSMADSSKHYPLSIETVKKIRKQNREGIRPEELEVTEIQTGKPKEVEPEYADIVGQISLKSLEKTSRKRNDRNKSQQKDNRPPRAEQSVAPRNRPPRDQQVKARQNPAGPQKQMQQRPPKPGQQPGAQRPAGKAQQPPKQGRQHTNPNRRPGNNPQRPPGSA